MDVRDLEYSRILQTLGYPRMSVTYIEYPRYTKP